MNDKNKTSMPKRAMPKMAMPALALRGLVIYPGMILHFDVGREKSILALKAASEGDKRIFLVTQKDMGMSEPDPKDVYKVGVVAEVRQLLKGSDNFTRVLVEGIYKAKVVDVIDTEPYFEFMVEELADSQYKDRDSNAIIASVRTLKNIFEKYGDVSPKMPKELLNSVLAEDDWKKIFDNIVFNIMLPVEEKQKLLEITNPIKKLDYLIKVLSDEVNILMLEREIHEEVKGRLEKNQRDYYLREQMRVISSQLGESDNAQDEIYEYLDRIEGLDVSDEVFEKLYKETEKLMKMPPNSHEAALIRTYLDTCLDLPWNTRTKDRLDLDRAKKQLDHDHHGLQKVKERILELLAVRMLNPDSNSQIICLVGPPGVGKTSIARSIATSIGKKYTRISLGGVRDESDIRGHRKTYIGAMPGRIINAMKVVDSKNPLILLDEIDKMSSDFRGDPASAMLEVLDSEQNSEFRDHYIEVPFDLSEVLFLTTANTTSTIPAPLLDRMDVIELGSYTREEKFNIAKRHLIKKQLKKHGLTMSKARITDSAIYSLIDGYTKEAGVRSLEREIAALLRKAARIIVSGKQKSISFTANNIEKYLGPKKYLDDELSKQDEIGAVNGLAWTSVGGVLMPLEVLVLDGKGKIELTGSLGDVMKESAKIAVSYARSIAKEYCIDVDFYKNKDIHIHAPEGAVPKDGPSAGIALTTAIISALSNIAVRRDIAMTGEVTLRGKVLPIGGLREKAMAAYKSGVKKVIIPKGNEADLTEVDDVVRENIEFVLVDDVKTVLEQALVSPNFCIKKIEHTGGMHKAQIDAIIKPITDKENATINS